MAARPAPRREHRDRGELVVEVVILVPVALLLVLLGVQASVYFHAANVAEHASSRGVSAASRYGATNGDGVAEATATVRDSGASLVAVSAGGGAEITLSVTVTVHRVVPFFPSSVTRTAVEPKERFVPEDER